MEHLAVIGGIIGVVTGFITILSALWRVSIAAADLRTKHELLRDLIEDGDRQLQHELEKLGLTVNGVRERMEHINTRISSQSKDLGRSLADVENFLQKSTAFEKRNRD